MFSKQKVTPPAGHGAGGRVAVSIGDGRGWGSVGRCTHWEDLDNRHMDEPATPASLDGRDGFLYLHFLPRLQISRCGWRPTRVCYLPVAQATGGHFAILSITLKIFIDQSRHSLVVSVFLFKGALFNGYC